MCNVCGCGTGTVEGQDHDHAHHHHHDHDHAHGDLHFGHGPAGVEVAGMSQERLIEIETDILSKDDRYAAANRARLAALGAFAINLVSSPGSGKTTLLCRTIEALGSQPLAVIEGDQQTANDADRIRATGAQAVQVNTGKGCHLDGHMVGHAMEHLEIAPASLLFIENVGNLVCPAAFDLGVYEANLRRVNPGLEVIRVSARTGEGMQSWLNWLEGALLRKSARTAAE